MVVMGFRTDWVEKTEEERIAQIAIKREVIMVATIDDLVSKGNDW